MRPTALGARRSVARRSARATRLWLGALAAGFALALLAGCGAATKAPARPAATPLSPGAQAAAQIKKRLERAGYDLSPPPAPIGPTLHPAKPAGQVATFDIEVDFTSPNSFHLYIAVFQTHAEAVRYLNDSNAERKSGIARCDAIPRCRQTFRGASAEDMFGVERVIGPAFYSASPDATAATISPATLKHVLALASGVHGV
jgi:hypothetical protein